MLTRPMRFYPVHPFATLFRNPTWLKAQILLVGAILAPGQRTVAAALRVMGRSDHRDYARYHEVLNRAVGRPACGSHPTVAALQHLDQGDGPLVFGIDGTLERRRGPKIKSLGIYRRCGALQPEPPGQGQWPALDLPMWLRFPGRDAIGPCPSSPCWRPRHATTGSADVPQKAHRLGPPDDPALRRCGSRSAPWCWWVTAATPYWTCSTAANPWLNPLPSSPACVWTPGL